MAVYTETKTYRTKAHMGMIDITDDFRAAVQNACRNTGMKSGTITGFTTGGVAGLTTLEFEPGMVYHDLKAAMDVFSPYRDEQGNVIYYHHHDTWHDDNGSSHIKAALLSPFIVIPFVNGEITIGPWQNPTYMVSGGQRSLKNRFVPISDMARKMSVSYNGIVINKDYQRGRHH